MQESDVFKTLASPSPEAIYKEKGSKFLAYAYPVSSVDEIEEIMKTLKKKHSRARHWCYAWKIGVSQPVFRFNDDGEPNNSAGKPIFGQIQSFDLTDVLIIVVRYFGGTKLGVGGLVNAYRTAARTACEASIIVERRLMAALFLRFEYVNMDKVMRLIKENKLQIKSQKMELDCSISISVRKKDSASLFQLFENLRCVDVKYIN